MSTGSTTSCEAKCYGLYHFTVSFCSVWFWSNVVQGKREMGRVIGLRTEWGWLFRAGPDFESLYKGTWNKFVPTAAQLLWWGQRADGGCASHPEKAEQRSNFIW